MNKSVENMFQTYPTEIRRKLMHLRQLILDVAADTPEIGDVEETLKWGEPSYLAKGGSTVRIGWYASNPDQYAMYFICSTKLVETFKEIYANFFVFDGNRAIVFQKNDSIPEDAVMHCVALSLQYHKLKHLPLLGA